MHAKTYELILGSEWNPAVHELVQQMRGLTNLQPIPQTLARPNLAYEGSTSCK